MSDAGAGRTVRTDVPMDQGSDYVVINWNEDFTLDAAGASNNVLGDVLGTLIRDLINLGIINGSNAA